jgi:hypothetical protein
MSPLTSAAVVSGAGRLRERLRLEWRPFRVRVYAQVTRERSTLPPLEFDGFGR